MSPGWVTIVTSIVGALATITVGYFQYRQGRKVNRNTTKIDNQEALLGSVLADLEEKGRKITRFEKFFTDIGLIGHKRPKELPENPDDFGE
jgi:hypothetical protein